MHYAPMPAGTAWGSRREYAWFKAEISLTQETAGKRLVLLSGLGGEQLVYVNGRALGSVDRQHGYVTLTRNAPETARLRLLIECYAGHGQPKENCGPCPPERKAEETVTGPQQVIGRSFLALFNETAYQLTMDVDTLIGLRACLDEGSLRYQKVTQALRSFTHTADFELPPVERQATFEQARAVLKEALGCKNGSTAPTMHLLGQSHIDLAWLWPMENTWHKAVRTYANQLSLMEEYPEYRFLACEPALLEMLEEQDPEVFQTVLKKVKSGQMQPEGAFYAECDTNLPSGESLIRQLYWGKRWFRERMGLDSQVAWQPDTFGFTACLPQLLRGFGIPYFATQKLLRADPETERFPYQDFLWEGADGTRVQALSFFKSNARTDPQSLHERWYRDRSQQTDIDALLYPFGYGDGGGGADRDMLEYLRREEDLEGLPRTRWTSLREHFERNRENTRRKLWKGELYLAWHRGTYTVQRRTKTALRRLEQALHDAEFLAAQAAGTQREEAKTLLRSAWKTLLLHQFHDIAAGVSIRDVHDEAVQALDSAAEQVRALTSRLLECVYQPDAAKDGCYTVLNTLPFRRREWICLPGGGSGYAALPASGAVTVRADTLLKPEKNIDVRKTQDGYCVDNGVLSFTLRKDGRITGLKDLRSGLKLQEEGMFMNDLRLYRNVESVYDAWELSNDYREDLIENACRAEVTLEHGAAGEFAALVRGKAGASPYVQRITLRAGENRIEFSLDIDWQETHKLLKAHFESNVHSLNAVSEMQFCHVQRPAHRSSRFAADRYEVCNHHYSALFEAERGVALFNRAIYGISCDEGDLALTLLRAPVVPDARCDRGQQHFDYALGVYDLPLAQCRLTEEGYAYNSEPILVQGASAFREGFAAEHAILETVKPAQEGEGIVLRVWENRGTRTAARLKLPGRYRIHACSLGEEDRRFLCEDSGCAFELHPFEIKTFLLLPEER